MNENNTTKTIPIRNKANSIDEVISILEEIILESESNNNTLGYFAALYQKVTKKVKDGIENDFFDDGTRMEKLDVVFANRYINAYYAYQKDEAITASWKIAFGLSTNYWPIVLQHLLIGMNAHINLDLGIAAAEISRGKDIDDLQNDFNKINEILSSLVGEVEQDLAKIWRPFKMILRLSGKVDDLLVDFSMGLARDGAWKFAKSIANKPNNEWNELIAIRDKKVTRKAYIITHPGIIVKIILAIIRLGERGSIAKRIEELKN